MSAFWAICRARLMGWAFDPLPRVAAFATLLACSSPSLHAQDGTASVAGMWQDPNGAALVGVYVILESAVGAADQTKADEQGGFHFSGLRAGSYTLSIRALGFDAVKVKQDLLAGEQRSLPPIRLNVGINGDCFPASIDPERSRFPSAGPSLGGLTGNVKNELGPLVGSRV